MLGVIFDGDDTLWYSERLYDHARAEVARIVAENGLDPTEWERLQRVRDVELVATHGFSATRFPLSNVQAYREVAERAGLEVRPEVIEVIEAEARGVFDRHAEVVSGAQDVLSNLRARGKLALVTRGEPWVQERRIQHSGLAEFFHVIEIVSEKTPEIFRSVACSLGVPPGEGWSVGNSLASDVYPALAAGLSAIWVDAHVWEYERARDALAADHVIKATRLAQVPRLLDTHVATTLP